MIITAKNTPLTDDEIAKYLPAGDLPLDRRAMLITQLREVGIRGIGIKGNNGPPLKYVPKWAHGRNLPWCAWFQGWAWEHAIEKHKRADWLTKWCTEELRGNHFGQRLGGVWDLYKAAEKAGCLSDMPLPGNIGILLQNDPRKRSPGHATCVLRSDSDEALANHIEGNSANMVRITTRASKDFAGFIDPYKWEHLKGDWVWSTHLLEAPLCHWNSLEGTR